MSAATRLRRLDESANIVVLERSGFVSYANCGLPYHLSETIEKRSLLILQNPVTLGARFNLDVRVRHRRVAPRALGRPEHPDGRRQRASVPAC